MISNSCVHSCCSLLFDLILCSLNHGHHKHPGRSQINQRCSPLNSSRLYCEELPVKPHEMPTKYGEVNKWIIHPIGKWIIHLKYVIVSSDDDTCERVQWKSIRILFESKFTLHISEQNKICSIVHFPKQTQRHMAIFCNKTFMFKFRIREN